MFAVMCGELLRVFKFGNKKNSEEKNRGNFGSLRKKINFSFISEDWFITRLNTLWKRTHILSAMMRELFVRNDKISTDHPSYSTNLGPRTFFYLKRL